MACPLIIAHRGASAEAPENTLAAFRRALALGVNGMELDVRVTRDGVPVVYHDATLVRLTGRRGRIVQLTLGALREIQVRGEGVPTLAEVLALVRDRAVVQIELKHGTPVAPVVEAVRRARAQDRVVLASFEPDLVAGARALAPRIPRMLIHENRWGRSLAPQAQARRLAGILAGLGAGGVSLNYRAISSPGFIAVLKSRGFCVWCWTVDDSRAMLRLAQFGVDAILTNDPALLQSTLARASDQL